MYRSDPEKSRNAGFSPIQNLNKPFGWVFLSKVPPHKNPKKKSGNSFPSAWRYFFDPSIFLPDFGVPLTRPAEKYPLKKIGCPRIFVQRFLGGRTSDLLNKKCCTYSPFYPFSRWEYQKFLTNAYLTILKNTLWFWGFQGSERTLLI